MTQNSPDTSVSGLFCVLLPGRRHGGLLTQMMTNLLDNAIKFLPEDGTVTVKLFQQEEKLWYFK